MNRDRWLSLAVATLVVLFFLQALRVLFSMLFGILYDEIFAGSPTAWLPISLALVVAALLAPFVTPARHGDLLPRAAAIVAALSRIVLTVNDAGVRYWGNRSSVTGAVGLLDRVAPLCFAAPVFFHSVRWYFV